MPELQSHSFERPHEHITQSRLTGQLVLLGGTYVARYIHEPGWRWSADVKPIVGTPSCQYHHQGVVLSGQMHVVSDDGREITISAGEAFEVPPGHDAWVIGDEPCITLDFLGVRGWASSPADSDRQLGTLLFTDLVGSTAMASRIGDAAWARMLERHYHRVRTQLGNHRGLEVATTGDGILAVFDSTARAVQCAAAIAEASHGDGMDVRIGVHSGEVQHLGDAVQGLAVHLAQRIMALAAPGEVWLSDSTVALLEGSRVSFADAGEHELKGVQGRRRLFRLVSLADG